MAKCLITLDSDELKTAIIQYLNRQGWQLTADHILCIEGGSDPYAKVTADSKLIKATVNHHIPCPVPGFD